jgi:hypothetical protein
LPVGSARQPVCNASGGDPIDLRLSAPWAGGARAELIWVWTKS